MIKRFTSLVLYLIIFLAMLPNHQQLSAQKIQFSNFENLTTSGRLPKEINIQKSNNNLDLAFLNGRYYLAFRTAPNHFPSKNAFLYVVSSEDRKTWKYETQFHCGADIREPRFAILKNTLLLYFFEGGKRPLKFEPKEIRVIKTYGNKWTKPESIGLDGYVPWRVRNRNDTLFLSAYYGKNLYGRNHKADLRIFYSTDGVLWNKISDLPQIDLTHAEEGEFIFASDGCVYAVVRLESNGALICKGEQCNLYKWIANRTKYKYDSSLLFEHNGEIYLISRRNLDGAMDKAKKRTNEKHGRARNLIRYSITKKKTAIFRLNKQALTLEPILDLPSTGDNAFPAIAKIDSNTYWLMNYSSDVSKREKSWLVGQFGKTFIYEMLLTFYE